MAAATIYNPKTEFYGAMREILDALRTEDHTCPFCRRAPYYDHDIACPLHRLKAVEEHFLAALADEPIEPRRECVLTIDRYRFRMMLTMGGRVTMWCDDLPTDTEIVGVDTSDRYEDFETNHPIRLVIASETFAPVLPHERPSLYGLTSYVSRTPMAEMCETQNVIGTSPPR